MTGDDLSAIAGPGLQTQEDLMAEADAAIIAMARLLTEAISELYGDELGDSLSVSVMRDEGKLLAVILSPTDAGEPRFAVDFDDSASIH